MFTVLDAVLLRPLPFPNAELLVKVNTYDLKSGAFYDNSSYPDFVDWRKAANPVLQSLTACEEKSFNLGGASEPQHVKGEVVSSDFFETLDIEPEAGRSLTFGTVVLILVLVAAAACSIPACRAASTDPIVALHHE